MSAVYTIIADNVVAMTMVAGAQLPKGWALWDTKNRDRNTVWARIKDDNAPEWTNNKVIEPVLMSTRYGTQTEIVVRGYNLVSEDDPFASG